MVTHQQIRRVLIVLAREKNKQQRRQQRGRRKVKTLFGRPVRETNPKAKESNNLY